MTVLQAIQTLSAALYEQGSLLSEIRIEGCSVNLIIVNTVSGPVSVWVPVGSVVDMDLWRLK